MIQGLLALTLLTACLTGTFWIAQRMILTILDAIREDRARRSFPWQRERLEFQFVQAVESRDPQQSQLWELACWDREICWARDRTTRRLMVLVGLALPDTFPAGPETRKIAVFEYRGGTWYANGRYIDSPTSVAACEVARLDAIEPPGQSPDWP